MPYASKKQRNYLHAFKPAVAAKFDAHEGQKRHSGDGGAAKKLKSASNKLRHAATRAKKYY